MTTLMPNKVKGMCQIFKLKKISKVFVYHF